MIYFIAIFKGSQPTLGPVIAQHKVDKSMVLNLNS